MEQETNSQPHKRTERIKFVVSGPVSAGKTQFIQTASGVTPVQTEVSRANLDPPGMNNATAALDFGQVKIDSKLIYLFGTPGQDRFEFMWDILSEEMDGLIFLLDAASLLDSIYAKMMLDYYLEYYQVPIQICANKQDLPNALSPEEVRTVLELKDSAAILPICAKRKEDVLQTLKLILAKIGK
ncbi:MAG: ATP/GTP-binding protein [bacterium]